MDTLDVTTGVGDYYANATTCATLAVNQVVRLKTSQAPAETRTLRVRGRSSTGLLVSTRNYQHVGDQEIGPHVAAYGCGQRRQDCSLPSAEPHADSSRSVSSAIASA